MRPDGKNVAAGWPWFGAQRMAPGPFLEEDANTVAHVYWDGVKLVDTKGNAWTMNGTVPQVNKSPLFPTGLASATRNGAGPYGTATNNYQGPSTLMEWAGDWSVTMIFMPTSFATTQIIVAKMSSTPTGWALRSETTGKLSYQNAGTLATSGASATLSIANIVTIGRSGNTMSVKLNGGTTATASNAASTAVAEPVRIGRYGNPGAGFEAAATVIYEIFASTTTFNESAAAALHARFSQQAPRYAT